MTWEIATFLSVCVVSLTVFAEMVFKGTLEANRNAEIKELQSQMNKLANQVHDVVVDHGTIVKMAEDTKKLLSNSNLAMGLSPRR